MMNSTYAQQCSRQCDYPQYAWSAPSEGNYANYSVNGRDYAQVKGCNDYIYKTNYCTRPTQYTQVEIPQVEMPSCYSSCALPKKYYKSKNYEKCSPQDLVSSEYQTLKMPSSYSDYSVYGPVNNFGWGRVNTYNSGCNRSIVTSKHLAGSSYGSLCVNSNSQ